MANQRCYRCGGSGKMTCTTCNGRGHTTRRRMDGSGDLDLSPCPRTMRCSLCEGRGYLGSQDAAPTNTGHEGALRDKIQELYEKLNEPGVKPIFIGVIAFGIEKGLISMSKSDLQQLTGSSNWFTGVTDDLVLWLQREGWLDTANR